MVSFRANGRDLPLLLFNFYFSLYYIFMSVQIYYFFSYYNTKRIKNIKKM